MEQLQAAAQPIPAATSAAAQSSKSLPGASSLRCTPLTALTAGILTSHWCRLRTEIFTGRPTRAEPPPPVQEAAARSSSCRWGLVHLLRPYQQPVVEAGA